jgi:hypothetical protein
MNNVKKHKPTILKKIFLAALLSLMVLPSTLQATTIRTADPGWLAWMGCWSPTDIQNTAQENLASLCIVNSEDATGLDILTIVNGSVLERRAVGLNGIPKEITSEECDGTEVFTFSDDGRHIFLETNFFCAGGQRKETGIMTMTSPQEWLEIRAIEIGGQTIPWVLRYGIASQEVFQTAGVEETVTRSAQLTRMSYLSPLTLANVVEAGSKVDPQAIEAWVLENAKPFSLNGDILKQMSFSGVAPNVLDAVIAVSFPNEFVLERFALDTNGESERSGLEEAVANGRIARQNTDSGSNYYGGGYQRGPFRYGYGRYADPFSYDPFRSYSNGYRYGFGYGFGYSPYYSRSNYRNIYNYNNWGSYRSPIRVTGRTRANTWEYEPGATVVPGRGYTRGGRGAPSTASPSGGGGNPPARSGGGGRTAKPRGGKPGGTF